MGSLTLMTSDEGRQFREEWESRQKGIPPLGWALRQARTLPWVRFHALPDSKRYATSDDEHRIVLARANRLGDRLLGPETSCWMIELRAGETAGTGALGLEWQDGDDPYAPVLRFYVEPTAWRAGAFDAQLLSIADDRARLIWMARPSGVLFAPYDGGFDLFSPSEGEVAAMRLEFSTWLSARPDGL